MGVGPFYGMIIGTPWAHCLDKFGQRVVYDAALSLTVRVLTIIDGQDWHWPLTNTLELMKIREQMHNVPPPSSACTICWVPSPNGRYSVFFRNW